jgi:hypothetical protein
MPNYTSSHIVCSCGRVYTRSGFSKHRHLCPTHIEVNRYSFGNKRNMEALQ